METKNKNKGITKGKIVGTVVGAAIGAGAYYLLGPDAKKHQRKAKEILQKMEKEVGSEIKRVGIISLPLYRVAVKKIADKYSKEYELYERDIKTLAKALKDRWQGTAAKVTKTVKRKTRRKKKIGN